MDYPRLAGHWRTHSAEAAESARNLSARGLSRSAAFLRKFNEKTESREDLKKKRGQPADPESTEQILAGGRAMQNEPASGGDRTAIARRSNAVPNGPNVPATGWEITHPIEVSRADGPDWHCPVSIRLADDGANSRELVELVVEQDPPRASIAPGDILAGRYVVIEKVNHCGMGLVYKALDRRRESAGLPVPWVALKFARPLTDNLVTTSSYLRQEFFKLSQLSHPNIVSVFDFDHHHGLDFIVMEWLEGQTLADLLMQITSKRIALDKAEEITASVGEALAHAHDRGIVHGDVKPSNIFLADHRTVKLLDFGSSGQSSVEGETEPHWATRAYASCEVLRGDAPQPHDDVYALGVTAYCLLSGERPFGELDAAEAKARGAFPDPLPADAHDRWRALEHALQFDAQDRPANAGEFLREFAEVRVEPFERVERTQLEHIAYGAVAVALLIALVAWTVGSIGGLPGDQQMALDNAERAFRAGQLLEPSGDSALALYASVLEAAPDNPRALDGLQRIAEHYLTRSREALAADDPEAAADNLALARRVVPEHYGIAITADLISRYGKDLLVSARQAAESDLEQAELLLSRAAGFFPAEDPSFVRARQEVARYRTAAQLGELLRGIDQRILAERLAVPEGDSAVDLLREARQLAPGDHQVTLAADRIATALLFQSMFAISNGELDEAERFISTAKDLNVKHLALSRAEYELAKARHAALQARSAGAN